MSRTRRWGRAVGAYLFEVRRYIDLGSLLIAIALLLFGSTEGLPWAIALFVVSGWGVFTSWRNRQPRGREMTKLYLELASIAAAYSDGIRLVAEGNEEPVMLVCKNRRFQRGFIRVNLADVALPAIDEHGYLACDDFTLLPFSNSVVCIHRGTLIDDDFKVAGEQEPTSPKQARKGIRSGLRSGHLYASAGDLRTLVHQVRSAREWVEP